MRKLEPRSLGAGLCWPSSLIWLANSLLACVARKLIIWLRGEKALITFWTARMTWKWKKTEAVKGLCLMELKSFAAVNFHRFKNFVLPMDALFLQKNQFDDKIFAVRPNCPFRKFFCLGGKRLHYVFAFIFDCFIEAASYQRAAYSPDLRRSNFFIIDFCCSCLYFYTLLEARKRQLITSSS